MTIMGNNFNEGQQFKALEEESTDLFVVYFFFLFQRNGTEQVVPKVKNGRTKPARVRRTPYSRGRNHPSTAPENVFFLFVIVAMGQTS